MPRGRPKKKKEIKMLKEEKVKKKRRLERPKKEKAEEIKALIKKPPEDIIPDVPKLVALSTYLYKSGMFPQFKNAHQALTAIEYGRELGIMPVQSMQTMFPIKGRLGIDTKAMLAVAIKNGLRHKILKRDENICEIEFRRDGFEPHLETFTSEDAERAELVAAKKENWKHFPKQMMLWRCMANGIRAYASDLALGLYSKEELEDAPTLEGQIVAEPIEQAQVAEETQKKEEDKEKQTLVNNLKYKLLKLNIDVKEFKKFLEEFQERGTKEPRTFVGYLYGNLSFRDGKFEDLNLLWQHFDYVVEKFREFQKEKPIETTEEKPIEKEEKEI